MRGSVTLLSDWLNGIDECKARELAFNGEGLESDPKSEQAGGGRNESAPRCRNTAKGTAPCADLAQQHQPIGTMSRGLRS